jgi:hypothetical protein
MHPQLNNPTITLYLRVLCLYGKLQNVLILILKSLIIWLYRLHLPISRTSKPSFHFFLYKITPEYIFLAKNIVLLINNLFLIVFFLLIQKCSPIFFQYLIYFYILSRTHYTLKNILSPSFIDFLYRNTHLHCQKSLIPINIIF